MIAHGLCGRRGSESPKSKCARDIQERLNEGGLAYENPGQEPSYAPLARQDGIA